MAACVDSAKEGPRMPAGSSGLNNDCGKFRDGRGNSQKKTQMQKLAKCMNQVGVRPKQASQFVRGLEYEVDLFLFQHVRIARRALNRCRAAAL